MKQINGSSRKQAGHTNLMYLTKRQKVDNQFLKICNEKGIIKTGTKEIHRTIRLYSKNVLQKLENLK